MNSLFEFTQQEIDSFAAEMVRDPSRPAMKSAQAVWGESPESVGKCLYAVNELVKDPRYEFALVLAQENERKNGIKLPTKEEVLKKIWSMTDEGFTKDRLDAAKLYCEISGFIDKGKGVTVNNITNRVMEVPVSASNDDWEAGLIKQQEKLRDGSSSTH